MLDLFLSLAVSTSTIGSFTVVKTPDPMNDKPRAAAAIERDGKVLSVNCNRAEDDGLRISITNDRPIKWFIDHDTAFVTVRFDDRKPEARAWNMTGEMVYVRKKSVTDAFVKNLEQSSHIAVRLNEYDDVEKDFDFDVSGASEAIAEVAKYCGISPP